MTFEGDDIKKGLAVEGMVRSNGWQIVDEWINEQIAIGKDKLLKVPIDKISSTRAKIKAYIELLNKINEYIEEKNRLIKEEQEK